MIRKFGYIEVPLKRVHLELTNICNFDCAFCPQAEMERTTGWMDVGLAKSLIDTLKEQDICEKVTFHVMGEPTLHPQFFEILDHAQEKGLGVGLTTNGALLGGSVGERLLGYDLQQIDISLQTPDESSFSLRRSPAISFDSYVDGLMRFFSSYMRAGKDTTIKFRFLNSRFCSANMAKKMQSMSINASNKALRETFKTWASRVYDALGVDGAQRETALGRGSKLVSYQWNVVEIYPKVFFETYILSDWEDRSCDARVRDAWAGYCFGMRDHFAVLHNGDVVLCCMDFNGRTTMGNLNTASLEEILAGPEVGRIMEGFRRFRFVHPYCRKCQGSSTLTGWLVKPLGHIAGLGLLKSLFYRKTSLWK